MPEFIDRGLALLPLYSYMFPIFQASNESSIASEPWARREIPKLSAKPGYTLTAKQALSFTKTSTPLLSINTLSLRGSSGPRAIVALSGALDNTSGNVEE